MTFSFSGFKLCVSCTRFLLANLHVLLFDSVLHFMHICVVKTVLRWKKYENLFPCKLNLTHSWIIHFKTIQPTTVYVISKDMLPWTFEQFFFPPFFFSLQWMQLTCTKLNISIKDEDEKESFFENILLLFLI